MRGCEWSEIKDVYYYYFVQQADAIVANISGYETSAVDEIMDDVNDFCQGVVLSRDLPIAICDDVTDAVRIIFDTYA